jgi:C-terminal processing protease CtpA/Prc
MIYRCARLLLTTMTVLFCLCWHSVAAPPAAPPARQAEMGGVGLQVVPIATGEIVVIAVLVKSPANKAKLRPGDLIIAVDGVALRGSKFADVTKNRLWGKAGTKVKLTWQSPGVAGKKSAQLVRAALKNEPTEDLEVQLLVPTATPVPEVTKP